MNLPSRNLGLIYIAASLRSFGIGLLGVVLGVFLYREGFPSTVIGLVIAAGLAGSAAATVITTLIADRLGRRTTLFVFSLPAVLGAVPLIFTMWATALIPLAFLCMLNAMGTARSASLAA